MPGLLTIKNIIIMKNLKYLPYAAFLVLAAVSYSCSDDDGGGETLTAGRTKAFAVALGNVPQGHGILYIPDIAHSLRAENINGVPHVARHCVRRISVSLAGYLTNLACLPPTVIT